MLLGVDRILLRVPSLDSAVRYYRDVLGMTLLKQERGLATLRFRDDPAELVLHSDEDLPAEAVYYRVESVQALYEKRAELRLQFVNAPTRISRGYRAAVRDPFGNHLLILDRTLETAGATSEDTKPSGGSLFSGVEPRLTPKREALIRIYEKVGRTADDLPYTPHFESLYTAYVAHHPDPKPTHQETWRHLLNLRKGGKLPKLGEARSAPPPIGADDRQRLRDLLGDDIGRRDRLPYTERFHDLVNQFNAPLPRPLSPHLVWRLVATLAK
jgi:catechol 2,3-dioxygenase-like lactoylglutathione lyase family enzyme